MTCGALKGQYIISEKKVLYEGVKLAPAKFEEKSELNAQLASRVTSGAWNVTTANLVEINNVCDGGPTLLAALRKAQALRQARA